MFQSGVIPVFKKYFCRGWTRITRTSLVNSAAMRQVVFRSEWAAAAASTLLLIFSFPDFDLYFLAWIALVPLLVAIARRPAPRSAFILGWATGTVFFYASCYWLTYSMIHYGGLPTPLAYLLLIPGAAIVGLFPGLFTLLSALAMRKWGHIAILLAPVFWTALEFIRLSVTGQLWNALGYSQAYHPALIRPAAWGGVYAVSFLIVAINAALVFVFIRRTRTALAMASVMVAVVVGVIAVSPRSTTNNLAPDLNVVAVQPNVPMTMIKTPAETNELLERHPVAPQGPVAATRDLARIADELHVRFDQSISGISCRLHSTQPHVVALQLARVCAGGWFIQFSTARK